jgi:hypothetical protein
VGHGWRQCIHLTADRQGQLAARVGIKVFVTGGIGGVHRWVRWLCVGVGRWMMMDGADAIS